MGNFDLKSYLAQNPLTEDNSVQEGIDFLTNRLGLKFQLNEAKLKPEEEQVARHAALLASSLSPELLGTLEDILNSVKGKSTEEIKKELTESVKEAEGDQSNTLMGKLRKFQKAGKVNLLPAVMALMFAWNALGSPATGLAMNALDGGGASTELVTPDNTVPDDMKVLDATDFNAQDADVTQDGKSLKDINDTKSQKGDFLEFDHGSGELTDNVSQQVNKLIQDVEKVTFSKSGKLVVKISGHSSNDAGANSNKSNTSDLPLDQERAETIKKALEAKLGNKIGDVDLEYKIVDGSDYQAQTKVEKGSTDGAGALVSLDVDGLNTTKELPTDAEKVIPIFKNAEYVEPSDVRFIEDKVKDIKDEEEVSTDAEASSDVSAEPVAPKQGVQPSSQKVTTNQISKDVAAVKSGALNRNGQIATVLRTLNFDNLNIFKEMGLQAAKSLTDGELSKIIKDPESTENAKNVAKGILSIRKNPDALLKKVQRALGVELDPRAPAVQVRPGQKGQASFLAGIAEGIISEAFIDDFITDDDIKKNKVAILALLGSMYASDTVKGEYLSIANPDKLGLSDSEKEQLEKLGWERKDNTGNYIFLDKTAADKSKEPKLQPDVDRALSTMNRTMPTADDKLALINTKDELVTMLVRILGKFAPEFIKDPTQVKTVLTTLRNQVKEEEEKQFKDVDNVVKIFDKSPAFQNQLSKINTKKEAVEYLIQGILKLVHPDLRKNKSAIHSAIFTAMNILSKKQPTNEAKLSKAELAKREDLIMSMKKNKRALVKKYGQDAEKVMYGRATNLAKKLAETDMEKDKLKEMVKAALMQTEKKEFPDLTGDGKVTKADILKARGVDLNEEEQLDEMAKIAGDLKTAIEKVIKANADAEKKDVRKAVKADDEVVAALGDEDLFDNQLNKFIDLVRGDREVGQRGRKSDPDKPAKEKGTRGRPKSATPTVKKKDEKVKTFSIGGDKKYYADDEDGPSDAELRKLARSGGKFDKSKLSQLRQQEKTKMVKDWLKGMRDKGIVDDANRILDKDAYAKEWAEAKVDIETRVKAINESPSINEGEDKTWALYVKSLVNDIRLNGLKDYVDYSESDFIEDYENYIGDRMMNEDLDLGHEDNEPHMLKADLYRIGKYAMELYQMVDSFEGMGEVDFPHWWQSKVITAKNNLVGAKHYLDFETKEPEIDAAVDAIDMSGTLDNIGVEPEMEPEMEPQIMTVDLFGGEDEIEKLAEKLAKQLKAR